MSYVNDAFNLIVRRRRLGDLVVKVLKFILDNNIPTSFVKENFKETSPVLRALLAYERIVDSFKS